MTESNGKGAGWRKHFAEWEAGEENADGNIRAYCPVHEDKATSTSPSAVFNYRRSVWNCFGGPACAEEIGGTLSALHKFLHPDDVASPNGKPGKSKHAFDAWDPEAPTYSVDTSELPGTDALKAWHTALMQRPDFKRYLNDVRGLNDRTIRVFGLGYDTVIGRYTIPVFSEGKLVNVRRYRPNADAKSKMLNWPGTHQTLFNDQVLQGHDEVVLCEGELDTMAAAQRGIAAVGHTGGARTWDPKLCARFKDKTVFVCYDCDDAGMEGARKVATALTTTAAHVYIVRLPLPYDGSDLTDYFVSQGYTVAEFKKLLEEARKEEFAVRPQKEPPPDRGKPVTLTNSMDPRLGNEAVEMVVTVAGRQDPPYDVPKRVRYTCTMDAGKQCQTCPMLMLGGNHEDTIDEDEPVLLEFIDATKKQVHTILRERISAERCDRLEKEWVEKSSLEVLDVTNSVEHRGEDSEAPTHRSVYNVGTFKTPMNTPVRIVGRSVPDPRSQRQTFLSWRLEPTQSDLDRFVINDSTLKRLRVFQPLPGQSPLKRMGDIARDLAANVTLIYGRPELHIAYDLVWHSAMDFKFQGDLIGRGWLDLAIIGDTRTGKSLVAEKLRNHYQAGVVQSCEGATFAGLVGGVQQVGQRWMVTWGLIPLHDRRLVVLDEVSGLRDKDVIENMSAIRSSGVAQLTKISTASTSARTRLVWVSNPVTGQSLGEITGGGMKALQDLVKNPEDVARFDFALAAAGPEVESSLINTVDHPHVEHVFTADLCRELVLWCWSRKAEDVKLARGVEAYVVEAAERFGARYVPDPPLVQQQNVRIKLARLAVAVAMRTFSTEDGRKVIVRREHVDAAVAFLDHIYGKEWFGYKRHSERELKARVRAREQKKECRTYLLTNEDVLVGLQSVMQDSQFRVRDFVDFANMSQMEAQIAVRKLREMGMVRRKAKGYISMTQDLVDLLREMED